MKERERERYRERREGERERERVLTREHREQTDSWISHLRNLVCRLPVFPFLFVVVLVDH